MESLVPEIEVTGRQRLRVKFFHNYDPKLDEIEDEMNRWLEEKDGRIDVKRIVPKYSSYFIVMVVYAEI